MSLLRSHTNQSSQQCQRWPRYLPRGIGKNTWFAFTGRCPHKNRFLITSPYSELRHVWKKKKKQNQKPQAPGVRRDAAWSSRTLWCAGAGLRASLFLNQVRPRRAWEEGSRQGHICQGRSPRDFKADFTVVHVSDTSFPVTGSFYFAACESWRRERSILYVWSF